MGDTTKTPGSGTDTDMVITPGGPRRRDQVHEVASSEVVMRGADGETIKVAPAKVKAVPKALKLAPDFVVTPGGPRHKSLVHTIQPGEAVTREGGKLKKLDLKTRALTELPEAALDKPKPPALGSGWITFAAWTNNSGKVISSMTTTWTVPPAPKTQSGQLIYLFNGLQDSPVTHILQPVLQWGVSPDGGGPFWAVASWFVDSAGNAFKSPLVAVNEGDTLTGVMTLTGQGPNGHNYVCAFQGLPATSLTVQNINELKMPVETLECYGMTLCTDYPSTDRTQMRAIGIQAGNTNLTPSFAANDAVTDCGQNTIVVSNSSPGGEVDLFYGPAAATPLVAGNQALLESSFRGKANAPGNLEVLVQQGSSIVHYWRDDSAANFPWHSSVTVSSAATAPAAMISSSFRANSSKPGNFEALILEGRNMVHYWRDNSAPGLPWHRGVIVSGNATGPATFIEGSFRANSSNPGNFEALVLEGHNLVHFWRDNSAPGLPWHRGVVVSSAASGPAVMIEGSFRANSSNPGNFEALVREGSAIVHYWRDNSAPGLPWHRGVTVSAGATGTASLIEGQFRANASRPGNFEALIDEGNLRHYWRDNSAAGLPWHRGVIV